MQSNIVRAAVIMHCVKILVDVLYGHDAVVNRYNFLNALNITPDKERAFLRLCMDSTPITFAFYIIFQGFHGNFEVTRSKYRREYIDLGIIANLK